VRLQASSGNTAQRPSGAVLHGYLYKLALQTLLVFPLNPRFAGFAGFAESGVDWQRGIVATTSTASG
jgi:hypothetical protein